MKSVAPELIFFDVDTQLDFLFPAGALYAPGAEAIVDSVGALARYAAANGIKIISTVDAHTENDPEFHYWKPHCVSGTAGQQKLSSSLCDARYVLPSLEASLDPQQIGSAKQIIVEKQSVDCFTNPNLGPLLEMLGARRVVLYGVVTEVCVHHAAVGLLDRGYQVEIVTDAIRAFSPDAGKHALDQLQQRGARLTEAKTVIF